MLGPGTDLEPQTRALLSLAHPAGLLRQVVDKRVLKQQRAFLKMLVDSEPAGRAVKEAIEAENAAVTAACGVVVVT